MFVVEFICIEKCICSVALYAQNVLNDEAFLTDVTVHNIAFDNSVSSLFFFFSRSHINIFLFQDTH